jgi:hypothetical protein
MGVSRFYAEAIRIVPRGSTATASRGGKSSVSGRLDDCERFASRGPAGSSGYRAYRG